MTKNFFGIKFDLLGKCICIYKQQAWKIKAPRNEENGPVLVVFEFGENRFLVKNIFVSVDVLGWYDEVVDVLGCMV